VRACVRVCVRACVRACVRVCVRRNNFISSAINIYIYIILSFINRNTYNIYSQKGDLVYRNCTKTHSSNHLSKFSGVKSYPNEWNLTQNEWKYCHSISRVAFSLNGVRFHSRKFREIFLPTPYTILNLLNYYYHLIQLDLASPLQNKYFSQPARLHIYPRFLLHYKYQLLRVPSPIHPSSLILLLTISLVLSYCSSFTFFYFLPS